MAIFWAAGCMGQAQQLHQSAGILPFAVYLYGIHDAYHYMKD
jgi:hypothetical protein